MDIAITQVGSEALPSLTITGGSSTKNSPSGQISYAELINEYEIEKSKRNRTDLDAVSKVGEDYQLLLNKIHHKNREIIRHERKELMLMRHEVDEKLIELKADKNFKHKGHYEDESLEESLDIADHLPEDGPETIALFNESIDFVEKEVVFLEDDPTSAIWAEMQRRRKYHLDHKVESDSAKALANHYFDSLEEKKRVLTALLDEEAKEKCIVSFAREIFDSIITMSIEEICIDMKETIKALRTSVDLCALKAVSELVRHNKGEASIVSGQSRIFMGTMDDMCRISYEDNATLNAKNARFGKSYIVNVTQVIKKRGFRMKQTNTFATIMAHYDTTCFLYPDQRLSTALPPMSSSLRLRALFGYEKAHWSDVNITPAYATNSHIFNLPKGFGSVTIMKLFPVGQFQCSYLYVGTHTGMLGVWNVSWRQTQKEPALQAISASLPRNEVSKVLDIKPSSLIATDQVVSLYENGHIRIWSTKSVSVKEKSIFGGSSVSQNVFDDAKRQSPITLFCVLHISPNSMNIPNQFEHTVWTDFIGNTVGKGKDTKDLKAKTEKDNLIQRAKTYAAPQRYSVPTAICFHPSTNFMGRNTSVMVGSIGGDILKFNIDFAVKDVQCPVMHLPPFVGMEYVIPGTFHEDIIIMAADKSMKGNKVFRELFHYHKAKIVYMGVINRTSDQIFSLDEANIFAVWRYQKDYFNGNCWFVPESTCYLDYVFRFYNPLSGLQGFDFAANAEPLELLTRLRTRKQYIATDNSVVEVFYPIVIGDQLTELRCRYSEIGNTSQGFVDVVVDDKNSLLNDHISALYYDQGTSWAQRGVTEVVIEPKVVALESSLDGLELYLLVTYQDVNFSDVEFDEFLDETEQKQRGLSHPDETTRDKEKLVTYAAILTLQLDTKTFRFPHPKFALNPADILMGFQVGPIIYETLTRAAFVHLNGTTIRVFSLCTGREHVSQDRIPLVSDTKGFAALSMCLCPSQRVLLLASPSEPRIALHRFQHAFDGQVAPVEKATSQVIRGYSRPVPILQAFSVKTIYRSNRGDNLDEPSIDVILKELLCELLDEVILPNAFIEIDENEAKMARIKRLEEVYGRTSDLGVIEPTTWSVDKLPDVDASDTKVLLGLEEALLEVQVEGGGSSEEEASIYYDNSVSSTDDDDDASLSNSQASGSAAALFGVGLDSDGDDDRINANTGLISGADRPLDNANANAVISVASGSDAINSVSQRDS